jgi:hypothetical protein
VLVGNLSTNGSARISGADRSYVFSAATNGYVQESLIGIGRGAWACNDTDSGTVSVSYQGDVVVPAWPDCCLEGPVNEDGLALLVFRNDSPQPVVVGLRQMTDTGDLLDGGNAYRRVLPACNACPEYDLSPRRRCNDAAVAYGVAADPGLYTLHIQYEGADVPDLQVSLTVSANTAYDLCYFVNVDRDGSAVPGLAFTGPIQVHAALSTTTCTGGTVQIVATVTDANGYGVPGAAVAGHVQYTTTGHDFGFPTTNNAGTTSTSVDTGNPGGGYTVVWTVTASAGGFSATTTTTCYAP